MTQQLLSVLTKEKPAADWRTDARVREAADRQQKLDREVRDAAREMEAAATALEAAERELEGAQIADLLGEPDGKRRAAAQKAVVAATERVEQATSRHVIAVRARDSIEGATTAVSDAAKMAAREALQAEFNTARVALYRHLQAASEAAEKAYLLHQAALDQFGNYRETSARGVRHPSAGGLVLATPWHVQLAQAGQVQHLHTLGTPNKSALERLADDLRAAGLLE